MATERAANPWPAELSYAERWQIAARTAVRHRKRLLAHRNVLDVGVGLEFVGERGTSDFRPVRIGEADGYSDYVPCVHVVVARKWRSRTKRPHSLPETLPARATIGGRRVAIAVPVDVAVRRPTRLGSWESAAAAGAITVEGSGTCFVKRRGDGRQFLLGCHHVLALTERQPPPANLSTVNVTWEEAPLGVLAELPVNILSVDAALASCSTAQPQVQFQLDGRIVTLSGVLMPGEPPPAEVTILTRHGKHSATYVAQVIHTESYFGNGPARRDLTFTNVLHFVVEPGETALQPGDSGGAVVDSSGRLIGVHYACDIPSGPESFALRADVVFRSFSAALTVF